MAASSALSLLSKPSLPRTSKHHLVAQTLVCAPLFSAVRPALDRVFLLVRLLRGNTAQRPAGKEFLVRTPAVRRNDGKARQFFVELAEPADDLVGKRHVVITVAEN